MKQYKINYKLLTIGNRVNIMAKIFKQKIKNTECATIENAEDLIDKISSFVVSDLKRQDFDIRQ